MKDKGSVLLESLLAVVVLSIAVTATMRAMVSSAAALHKAQRYSKAVERIENALTDIWSNVSVSRQRDAIVREEGVFDGVEGLGMVTLDVPVGRDAKVSYQVLAGR